MASFIAEFSVNLWMLLHFFLSCKTCACIFVIIFIMAGSCATEITLYIKYLRSSQAAGRKVCTMSLAQGHEPTSWTRNQLATINAPSGRRIYLFQWLWMVCCPFNLTPTAEPRHAVGHFLPMSYLYWSMQVISPGECVCLTMQNGLIIGKQRFIFF